MIFNHAQRRITSDISQKVAFSIRKDIAEKIDRLALSFSSTPAVDRFSGYILVAHTCLLRLDTLKGKEVAFWVRKVASFGTAHINDFANSDALVKQLLAGFLHVFAAEKQ